MSLGPVDCDGDIFMHIKEKNYSCSTACHRKIKSLLEYFLLTMFGKYMLSLYVLFCMI